MSTILASFLLFYFAPLPQEQELGNPETETRVPESPKKTADEETTKRVDILGQYDDYSTNFGPVKTLSLTYYQHLKKQRLTYYVGLSGQSDTKTKAGLITTGAFKDWTDHLYTYTALCGGQTFKKHPETELYPQFRALQQFYYKLGGQLQFVPFAGVDYFKFFGNQKTLAIDLGFNYYLKKWIFSYHFFEHFNWPGNHHVPSHQFSVGHGKEGDQWTFLTGGFGKNAYTIATPISAQDFNLKFWNLSLTHRHWILKHFGIMANVSYLDLRDTYHVWSGNLGIFQEF